MISGLAATHGVDYAEAVDLLVASYADRMQPGYGLEMGAAIRLGIVLHATLVSLIHSNVVLAETIATITDTACESIIDSATALNAIRQKGGLE